MHVLLFLVLAGLHFAVLVLLLDLVGTTKANVISSGHAPCDRGLPASGSTVLPREASSVP